MADSSQNQPQHSADDLPKVDSKGSNRLPFEPKKRKKKQVSLAPSAEDIGTRTSQDRVPPAKSRLNPNPTAPQASSLKKSQPTRSERSQSMTLDQTRIPDSVSRRMISRILVFSGIPTLLGVSSFFISYLVITQKIMELPNVAVLFTSLGCFGLGVLGLSYGVLSASWEEEEPGTLLGLPEFRVNVQRFLGAWREFRQGKTAQTRDKD